MARTIILFISLNFGSHVGKSRPCILCSEAIADGTVLVIVERAFPSLISLRMYVISGSDFTGSMGSPLSCA